MFCVLKFYLLYLLFQLFLHLSIEKLSLEEDPRHTGGGLVVAWMNWKNGQKVEVYSTYRRESEGLVELVGVCWCRFHGVQTLPQLSST